MRCFGILGYRRIFAREARRKRASAAVPWMRPAVPPADRRTGDEPLRRVRPQRGYEAEDARGSCAQGRSGVAEHARKVLSLRPLDDGAWP